MSFFLSRAIGRSMVEMLSDMDGKEPQPGDLIEVFRGPYKHWAVYIGEGNVVHFGADDPSGQRGVVVKEKLKDVVKKDKWKINNYLDGKCKPRSSQTIVKEACKLVGSGWKYDFLKYNCEHFATEMRYGKPECRQVKEAQAGMSEFILEAAGAALLGLVALGVRFVRS